MSLVKRKHNLNRLGYCFCAVATSFHLQTNIFPAHVRNDFQEHHIEMPLSMCALPPSSRPCNGTNSQHVLPRLLCLEILLRPPRLNVFSSNHSSNLVWPQYTVGASGALLFCAVVLPPFSNLSAPLSSSPARLGQMPLHTLLLHVQSAATDFFAAVLLRFARISPHWMPPSRHVLRVVRSNFCDKNTISTRCVVCCVSSAHVERKSALGMSLSS